MIPQSSMPDSGGSASVDSKDSVLQLLGVTARRIVSNQTIFMLILLLVMLFGFSRLSPYFLTKHNLMQISIQAAVFCMLGAGQTFVILTAGIDLGVGSVLALVTVTSAIAMEEMSGMGFGGLIVGLLVGMLGRWAMWTGKRCDHR